jgi:hypothetical protein
MSKSVSHRRLELPETATQLCPPQKLPLLEALCWNIANPYKLSLEQILSVYESRWKYLGILGEPSQQELSFIEELCWQFKRPNLIPEYSNMDKQQFYELTDKILSQIDSQFLLQQKAYFGGGTMLGLEADCYRLSYDLDFICNLNSYNQIRRWFSTNRPEQIFSDKNIEIGTIKKDAYSIRMPVRIDSTAPIIKLEFIAETRFELGEYEVGKIANLPILRKIDRYISKLLANADRATDSSTHSRDLIDLAVLRLSQPIPQEAIDRAEANYPVVKPLIEAIDRFSHNPEHRISCYEALRIDDRVKIIDGLDKLASDYGLQLTQRSFLETDFSYLG